MTDRTPPMRRAAELGLAFLEQLPERHVGARATSSEIAATLGGPLPEDGTDPVEVVELVLEDTRLQALRLDSHGLPRRRRGFDGDLAGALDLDDDAGRAE